MGRDRVSGALDRPPAFLADRAELWRAWSQLQASGKVDRLRGHGWQVWSERLGDGGTLLCLAVEFRPTDAPISWTPVTAPTTEGG